MKIFLLVLALGGPIAAICGYRFTEAVYALVLLQQ